MTSGIKYFVNYWNVDRLQYALNAQNTFRKQSLNTVQPETNNRTFPSLLNNAFDITINQANGMHMSSHAMDLILSENIFPTFSSTIEKYGVPLLTDSDNIAEYKEQHAQIMSKHVIIVIDPADLGSKLAVSVELLQRAELDFYDKTFRRMYGNTTIGSIIGPFWTYVVDIYSGTCYKDKVDPNVSLLTINEILDFYTDADGTVRFKRFSTIKDIVVNCFAHLNRKTSYASNSWDRYRMVRLG